MKTLRVSIKFKLTQIFFIKNLKNKMKITKIKAIYQN